ncbi:toxin-activating lysine-acyltransferase [Candidatus Regiella insecticola]|uniref:RTX toxin-activating lysine-acyltransferase n=1 Tax=Candidatus Regiella insecticola TaxID=138073 RepID=A0A6L2ZN47_9ENTR|nr:toxin-activating lysine-acyltransferase [Candidatus Regiella insecticola]GFN46287.1 RTX toxin activating protein [Candidatus Regiella insecticola]
MPIHINPVTLNIKELQRVIGGVLLLSQYSPLHRLYSIGEWQQRTLPSFQINQYCYYENSQGKPVAFFNWAFVSEKIRDELCSGRNIIESDWQSGENIFIPEMIAPFGQVKTIVKDIRQRIFLSFKGKKICAVRGKILKKNENNVPKIQWFTI